MSQIFSTLDENDIDRNTASSLRSLVIEGFMKVVQVSSYKPA